MNLIVLLLLSLLLVLCRQGRQWQKALVLLREMEVVDGLPGNLICYNAAADACGKVSHSAPRHLP